MKVSFYHTDFTQCVQIDPVPKGFPLPVVGDILSGKEPYSRGKKPHPESKNYAYIVILRRFHYDWKEVWIFVEKPERKELTIEEAVAHVDKTNSPESCDPENFRQS